MTVTTPCLRSTSYSVDDVHQNWNDVGIDRWDIYLQGKERNEESVAQARTDKGLIGRGRENAMAYSVGNGEDTKRGGCFF